MQQMRHNNIPMFLQNRKCNKDVKVRTIHIGPERFPETEYVWPFKLAFIPYEQHAEEEEKVGRIGFLEVEIEFWVHELDEVVKSEELVSHARLVA